MGTKRDSRKRSPSSEAQQRPRKRTYWREGSLPGRQPQGQPSEAGGAQDIQSSQQKPTYAGAQQNHRRRSGRVEQNYGSDQTPGGMTKRNNGDHRGRRRDSKADPAKEKMHMDHPKDVEIARLNAIISQLRNREDQTLQEQQRLQNSREEANNKIREIRRESREKGNELRKVERELLEKEGELQEMEKNESKLLEELKTAKDQVREWKQRESALIEKNEADISKIQREGREREGELRKTQGELQKTQGELQKTQSELWEREKGGSKLEAELETAKERLWEKEKSVVKLEAELETANDQLRKKKARETASTTQYEDKISKIQCESQKRGAKLQEMQGKLQNMKSELREKQKGESKLVAELETAKEKLSEKEKSVVKLEAELETANDQLRKKKMRETAWTTQHEDKISKIQREREGEDRLQEMEGKPRDMEGELQKREKSENKPTAALKEAQKPINRMGLERPEMKKGRRRKAAPGPATYQTGALGLQTRREVGQHASTNEVNAQMDMLNMGFDKMDLS